MDSWSLRSTVHGGGCDAGIVVQLKTTAAAFWSGGTEVVIGRPSKSMWMYLVRYMSFSTHPASSLYETANMAKWEHITLKSLSNILRSSSEQTLQKEIALFLDEILASGLSHRYPVQFQLSELRALGNQTGSRAGQSQWATHEPGLGMMLMWAGLSACRFRFLFFLISG